MEFKSLKNIESSFRQIRLFGIVFLSLCAVITVWSVWSSYRFAEEAAGEDLRAGQRQVADAGALAGFVAEPPGGGKGTRAPLPRTVLHALARKERDRA